MREQAWGGLELAEPGDLRGWDLAVTAVSPQLLSSTGPGPCPAW